MSYFTDKVAIEIWKARWYGIPVQDLVAKYRENPFRFYEVWEEKKNVGTRLEAYEQLKRENPLLAANTNPVCHVPKRKVIHRRTFEGGQIEMFQS
ncbi:hypothetical protein [Allorhizobium terrae]|uniref:Uncharacterized protein n=1 Tax=Allorhizobium terrae TaxID=1848972 RepID=A0A4S3ZWY3_9HYPH|nr:hypothetical protein [Allorhizobium terrae]THF50347.1 hypothetical protein E6C51_11495 [Allorhizobium terrae]